MSFAKSKSTRSVQLLRWAGTFLSILLLIYLLSQQGWGEIALALAQIPSWIFVLTVALMVISRFAVAGRWHALLRATQMGVTWRQSLRLTFAGLFATNFLPTTIGGDVVRLAGAIQYGIDGSIAAASLVVDRLVGMLGMALAVPLGIMPMLNWLAASPAQGRLPLIPTFLLAADAFPHRLWQKLTQISRKILQAIKLWWQHPSSLLGSFIFTLIHMFCFFGIIWMLFLGLGDPISFSLVAGLYSFVYIITLLPVSINGYGLQEISISFIFSQVGDIPIQDSLTVALIFRTLTILTSLPGALFIPGMIAARKNPPEAIEEVDR